MTTLTIMRSLISESRNHDNELHILRTMLQEGHPDSIQQRARTANALTRYQRVLATFRQRYPSRTDQMLRIILANR